MTELIKCEICGKTFLGKEDSEGVIICEDCKETVLAELSDGKGDEDDE